MKYDRLQLWPFCGLQLVGTHFPISIQQWNKCYILKNGQFLSLHIDLYINNISNRIEEPQPCYANAFK